jgi:hypothetical protein
MTSAWTDLEKFQSLTGLFMEPDCELHTKGKEPAANKVLCLGLSDVKTHRNENNGEQRQ